MLYSLVKGRTLKQFSKNRNYFAIGFGSSFNPDFDGNALAWYDGDVGLTVGGWLDQGGGGHDLVFANNPAVDAVGLNGHGSVNFDGINQSGNVINPALNQPFTIYLVLKQITWTLNDRLMNDGVIIDQIYLAQRGVTPRLDMWAGVPMTANPELLLDAFYVETLVLNGITSELRTGLSVAVIANAGANNANGITIGARPGGGNPSNVEYAYIIIRTGADSTAIQNKMINGLNSRFGLAFDPDFDGNALAWYDGDAGLNTAGWLDASGGGHDLVFANNPTIDPIGLNGHGTVLFDGINQNGIVATPPINQPYTLYVVFNRISFTSSRTHFDDGIVSSTKELADSGASSYTFRSPTSVVVDNNKPTTGNFDVFTIVQNGASSEYRWNDNAGTVINPGAATGDGLVLGSRPNNTRYGNSEFAYVVIRTGVDSTATQNQIINALKKRFGL